MARPRIVSRLLYAAGRLRQRISPETHETPEEPAPAESPRSTDSLLQETPPRPAGCLLWVHAETSGETGASLALAQELARLRAEPVHTLITTLRNAAIVPAIAEGAIHQLVPGESTGSVERFLDHWKPDLGVFLGLPDRPNLIAEAHDRGIPLFLVASRRGETPRRGRLPYLSALLLSNFRICLAASAADAQVYMRDMKDRERIEVTGPLSDTAHALPCQEAERDSLARTLGGRPVWLAANIVPEEIAAAEAAQRRAIQAAHRLLLIIVPRQTEDGPGIAESLESLGWHTSVRSDGGEPAENVQIYIADTTDELGLWYRLAPITFIGGSLTTTREPSDPYEPAALGSVVVHGPHLGRSKARFDRLADAGAHYPIDKSEDLGAAILTLLSPDKAATLAHAGWATTTESAPVIGRLAELMDEALDERDLA